MTLQAPENRDGYLFDLSRWNRAGLTRFEYVDGDAAVWLEELRIAMQGLYLRDTDPVDRTPEKWRDLFMKPVAERQLNNSAAEYETSVVWKDIYMAFPVDIETGGKRNQRLLEQYDRQSPDYAWETMRAFARAAHILLGHQDAYANEGYLRTATQWENLRKLAAMVNYQPTPPASATSTVALEIESDKGVIEIARGLAMKYAPPEGGAPLIFETLKPVFVHPKLNAVRAEGWNFNNNTLNLSKGWIVPEKAELAQGDLVVVTAFDIGTNTDVGKALSLETVDRYEDAGSAELTFNETISPPFGIKTGDTLLLTEPEKVQLGMRRTIGNRIVIKLDGADSYSAGAIVQVTYNDGSQHTIRAVVVEGGKGLLTIDAAVSFSGDVKVEALTPYMPGVKGLETEIDLITLYYMNGKSGDPVISRDSTSTRNDEKDSTIPIAQKHTRHADALGYAYGGVSGKIDSGAVIDVPTVGTGDTNRIVRFEGIPPKSLKQDDWYAARPVGTSDLTALKVSIIRQETDVYYIEFDQDPLADHDKVEFFGPMTRTLHPVEYNRDQSSAVNGGVASLAITSSEARDLVKVGRDVIVIKEKDDEPLSAHAVILSIEETAEIFNLTLESEQDFTDWQAGWTKFYLNTVDISHGETRDPKILGSGDAEQGRQIFQFKITDVSFIPSNTASTGVAPDMDVTVDGVKWEFRDIGDPTAEGDDAWSAALNEDDTLQIHFRRRLPTGTNNVSISRHRVGVGAKGTGVPSRSITKPMKKNRFVTGVVQPFITAGGAAREPVADIRQNAPSKLAANGRAVSLRDFEQLCRRHSSVWQAKAREVIGPGAVSVVDVVIVPAGGGIVVGTTLEGDLIDFVESRTLPNTQVTMTDFKSMPLKIHVKIYVDTNRYEKTDVKDAVEAGLVTEFALKNRGLGQPVYVAEILAAMEKIEGVSSATITDFSLKDTLPEPLSKAEISGSLAAIFPTEEQVAVLNGIADVTVDVEVMA